ncbi:DNA alkylation repair protein [Paracoccus haeundaensis]|uniref:DNA alkylation repair protein n=1 Tax=Paracoccus haeundaensis TaxID=225362 RepID=A0A5C4RAR3_9RHOB|nr:DNA alkylation repair protein [Paracoccus haeundaensis]TNH41060.1 DNA alkylation repair protein [Paracoccus haeundaensis]
MQELDRLRDLADPERAARASARHKRDRETLGITPAGLEEVVAEWRAERDLDARIALAEALWDSDVHEARLAAARLLVQARMRPDDAAWAAIMDWAPQIDGAEIDDAVMTAAARRVVADPTRLDQITAWAGSRNPWLRRGVMLATLPWAKMNNPKPEDLEIREKVLQLMLRLASDRHGGVRQAAKLWLRNLEKRDPDRVAVWHRAHEAMAAPEPQPEPLAEDAPPSDDAPRPDGDQER